MNYTEVLNTEINTIVLKPGNVVTLKNSKDGKYHNMVIIPIGDKLGAIEELFSDDKIITGQGTVANYCYLRPDLYPDTLGIEPVFGETLCMVYPHLGWCKNPKDIIEITYYDENGVYCGRGI